MRSAPSLLLRLLGVLALSGCSLTPEAQREDRTLRFRMAAPPAAPTITVGAGYIQTTGVFAAPCPEYPVLGVASLDGRGEVILYVQGEASAACAAGTSSARLGYEARVGRLRAGTHRFLVVHRWPGDEWTSQVMVDTTLQVP